MRKKTIIIIAGVVGILLSVFFSELAKAQVSPSINLPGTPEEIKDIGIRALKLIPRFLKEIWLGVLEFLQKIWDWIKTIWNSYFYDAWLKINRLVEERILIIKQELEKEFLWQKFKELIK